MNSPDYQDLELQIDECMLADRFRMLRDLKKKKERQKLARAIKKSKALAAERQESVPALSYPVALPVSAAVPEIKAALQTNQVVIIAGETGSGKTTQIPKICLEAGRGVFGTIGHTQPRRVAARTIAHRLAEELGVELGQQVGYQVRFQDHSRPSTLIKVMTDGILLAETQNDRFLERYDTIIIDEAHERSLNIDFILGYLKRILPKRPDLKIVITSATIDLERFSKHFDQAPVLEVSGRTFPVEVRYRTNETESGDETDEQVIQAIVESLNEIDAMPNGDVLVFLPGEREIRETAQAIRKKGPKGFDILPLYSRLSISEQNRVFQAHTSRRVILATNVAETSLTVPGVKYVIDSGVARMSRYSFRSKVQQLPIEEVSKASADQRKGRCGRTDDGVCFRLYSEENFAARSDFTEPEILRTNLASVILKMLVLKLGDIARFPFVEKPGEKHINDGFALLFELGAVDRGRQVTRLGKQLSRFTIDLRFARMLVAANQFGCTNELMIIASALSIQDPRERPFDHQKAADEKHKQYWIEKSDFLSFIALWQSYEQQRQSLKQGQLRKYCKQNFLSYMRMREWREIHRQLILQCREEGFRVKQTPAEYSAVHRSILAGLLSHIANKSSEHEYQGARNRKQFIFPGSSLFSSKPKWMVSAELVETSRLFARSVAEIDKTWIEPIAGHLVVRTHHDPKFDSDLGQVVAREEVTLYGLVILNNRMVDYGYVDAIQAREIFIEKALVEGELKSKLKFYKHNQKLIRDIEQMESKTRKRDILVESRMLFEFYDAVLPTTVSSEFELKGFLDGAPQNAGQLKLSRDELMRREAEISEQHFPDRITVGNTELSLDYKFEPGTAEDGVSVEIPLVMLSQVSRQQLDWVIPGLLREKCLALIKSLPKSIRKNFVPAPDYADRAVEQLEFDGRGINEALADRLFRLSGRRVEASDFQSAQLASHLSLNIRVVDDKGKTIARGRDLDLLLAELGEEVSARFASRAEHELERSGITTWDFEELPATVALKEGKVSVVVYPALVDERDSVSITLMDSAGQAQRSTEEGVLRLLLFELAAQRKFLQDNIPGFDQFSLYYATRGSKAQLVECIVKAVFRQVFLEGQLLPRRRQAYLERLEAKSKLHDQLEVVSRAVGASLKQTMGIQDQLNSPAFMEIREDVQAQLNGLISSEFPSDVPFESLRHYPRYLKAIEYRLSRYVGNAAKDRESATKVRAWLDRLAGVDAELLPQLAKFKWMLEEYRISLFAQSIGTNIRVSDKRLEKEWQAVMGLRK